MKKSFVIASVLLSGVIFAQEKKDSITTNNLDEVIINTFIKKDTDSSNKMPLKFIENPQVFSSVDKSVLENQVLFTIDDAYRNVTGLQKLWNSTGRSGDGGAFVTMRGFQTNNALRNGLVAPVTTTIDAVNLERLEVLKGPSATMFGSNVGSYGGIINRVTKKPYENFGGNVSIAGGSYNFYRAQADINAPITNDKSLMFRLNTAYTNTGTFQKKNVGNEFYAFTPSLRYKLNDKLDINVDLEMFENKAMAEQMFFYLPSLGLRSIKEVEKTYGLDYKQSYVGDDLKTKSSVRNVFGQVNYKITDHIQSSTNLSSAFSKSNGFSPYFAIGANPTNPTEFGVVRADQSTRDSKKTTFQIQQNFNFDYQFGNMRNRTVVGADYMRTKNNQMFISANFDWVPFKGGDYSNMNGNTLQDFYNNSTPTEYPILGTLDTYSAYISNVFTPTTGLNIMAAVRYESNDSKDGKLYSNDTKAYNQAAWSPKFGFTYEIIPTKFSVFGNYQNSFKSNGYYATDINGNIALSDPETANQFEGGLKMNIVHNKINATLSYYNITVKNSLLYTGEFFNNISVQTEGGKIKSEGVELEVNAYLVKGFSVIGGVSYNDAIIKEDVNEANVGTRPATAGSKWLANFNATYQFLNGNLKGFGIGVGGNYSSDNYITPTFYLPEYFILNANAFYDTKKFRIGVKVDNLTNQKYWIGYSTANAQQLVNAVGSLTYKF
ncbi:iron complex outermembrane recepter protein [Chishuiella changwenlii]|uniref:Iron complex outermembrane recepter protein n=1 Tax=Chishuiella changwenlii TaxID=1434701 RepID=A0A1M7C9S0_9FLAO|nr:TonB-dependent receptor [Chishuiella changwenlii]GGF06670.1 TonB-dependent receptor [Chishuiella changwenlii]SHL63954.1 iron complex outermembrane recepter protein [Chishuiella changwenlii]